MKKIALIYMGGTFGCIGDPLTPMHEDQFIPQLQKVLPAQHTIECFKAPSIKDSSACTAEDWLLLIQQIQNLQQQHYQYFVVLHGTDTLSYAAAVLSQFLQNSCSVVITGSQYPLLNTQGECIRELTDALNNLNTALEHVLKVPLGVHLAFYDQVFHASTALKFHSTELDAFRGQRSDQKLAVDYTTATSIQNAHIERAKSLNVINMMMLPIEQQQLYKNLQALQPNPPDFLILQAYGVGNLSVNHQIINSLKILQQQHCVVILATQVPFGGLDQRYAISQWIKEAQIIISDAQSQADLYAKILKIYLQYPSSEQWYSHWYEHPE